MNKTAFPILQTKLHRPPVSHDFVARPRLWEQLERGIAGRLTLVCAPAGFGKTTLVSSFIEKLSTQKLNDQPGLPIAWLSLDKNDSECIIFLNYVIAAIRTIFSDACSDTYTLLKALHPPSLENMVFTLSNEIEQLPGEFILVLDDYHLIQGDAVQNLLDGILLHWPKTLHLVLIARNNPPLPLARLRANGQLSEVRSRDLRFTQEETAEFLHKAVHIIPNNTTLEKLNEMMEGWIGALRLVSLSMRTENDVDSLIRIMGASQETLADYLVSEVLANQLPAVQKFLLETSILDRFSPELCEAVIGQGDPAWSVRAMIDWLERLELFIVPLDEHKEWYRYHHLFKDLLQRRFFSSPLAGQVNQQYQRASRWSEEQGLLDDSLRYAFLSNNMDLVIGLMERGLCDVLNRGDTWTLDYWIRILPQELVEQRPWLLMIKCWVAHFSWQHNALFKYLDQVENLIEDNLSNPLIVRDSEILHGQIAALRSQEAYLNNQLDDAIAYSHEALELLPKTWKFGRGGAAFYLYLSRQARGEAKATEADLIDLYQSLEDKSDSFALRLLMALCYIYLNENQLEKCRQTAELLLYHSEHSKFIFVQAWAHSFLGSVYYQWNELELADKHFSFVVENYTIAHQVAIQNSLFGMACVNIARGEKARALQIVERARQLDIERMGFEDRRTLSLQARIMLEQSDRESAYRWADAFGQLVIDHMLFFSEEPHLTQARIFLARNRPSDVSNAIQILDSLYQIAERTYNVRYQIEILGLRALALDSLGQTGDAIAALERSFEFAKIGHSVRIFVDLGSRMFELVRSIAPQNGHTEIINLILAAFAVAHPENKYPIAQPKLRNSYSEDLIDPLTLRELEILSKLQEPLSMKQIASQLNISPMTVKRHAINIYSKLNVSSRWDAVAKGEDLGFIQTH